MVKKRVETDNVNPVEQGMKMGNAFTEQPQAVIKQPVVENNMDKEVSKQYEQKHEPVNCLRNERVIVRFVPKQTAMVHDKRHVLYGGMAQTATRNFVVPLLTSGRYKNVLTDNEKEFLEQAMGLEKNALSIYKKYDNFWDDSNPRGIGRVTLHKQDTFLDLSIPEDYIKYKVLLANSDKIAPSLQELEDRPKATYQYVLISESGETKMRRGKADIKRECYMELGKVRDDVDTMRVILELLDGRPISNKVKADYLEDQLLEHIDANPRQTLSILKDDLLPAKVLIKKGVEHGVIGKRNDMYYLRQDGSPLCEMGEESTLTNAAKYISSVKRQELKYSIEAKVKE